MSPFPTGELLRRSPFSVSARIRSEGYSSLLAAFHLSVCLSVSVTTLAKASLGSTLRQRYVQDWNRLFSVLSSWIFEKTFHSKLKLCLEF